MGRKFKIKKKSFILRNIKTEILLRLLVKVGPLSEEETFEKSVEDIKLIAILFLFNGLHYCC